MKNNNQPWVNPYWSKPNQNKSESIQNKNPQPSNNSNQNLGNKSYINTKSPEKPTVSTETWQNPYWKDNKTSKQNTNDKPFVFPHKVPPIPSFYHRIYPPPSPLSTSVPNMNTNHETILSSKKYEANINDDDDDDDLPYTLDSQGRAHYRAVSSAPKVTNQTSNFASAPKTSQNPVLSQQKPSSVSFSQTANTAPHSQTTTSSAIPSFMNNITQNLFKNTNSYPTFSTSHSVTVLTETELNSIHDALRLLETNPNAIPVIETFNHIPINHHNKPSSSSAPLFTTNREQQPSSSFSRNVQFHAQPTPLFSTPSYPSNSNDPLRRMTKQGSIALI